MSNIPEDLYYAASHEWLKMGPDGLATVGITDFAQSELGDVVYVELPVVGTQVNAGQPVSVVESVKTASDINAPVSGEVVAVNDALVATPENINSEPYEGGWLFKLRPSQQSELEALLNAGDYQSSL
ncbi:MAG: glycine cleavage system protein GcvH [Pseudomonadales bacterium]|nr:glycine cleavage system protein GcvH [Pseudomonadales bacterium]